MMKRLLFTLFVVVLTLQVRAANNEQFFARIIPDRDVIDDSNSGSDGDIVWDDNGDWSEE